MAALTGNSINSTYIDLLQVSNSNSGIDGTRRNISDGEGTNAPITVSTSAAAFTGIMDASAATVLFAADAIPLAAVDLSGDDTISGNIDVASGSTIDFVSGSTLDLSTGSTFTSYADAIPLASVDLSDNDTIGGALTVASGASLSFASGATLTMTSNSTLTMTSNSTLDVSAATLLFSNDQIPLAKVDLSDNDTISGALDVASGASLEFASGSTLTVNQDATLNALQVGLFQEQQTAGTDGGALTASAWRTRDINATVTNNISGASLSSSQVTLQKGRYKVSGFAVANRTNGHKARLYNSTASAVLLMGHSAVSNASVAVNTASLIQGEFTLATASAIELQHRPQATRATDGRGLASSVSASEIYSEVLFTRVGA